MTKTIEFYLTRGFGEPMAAYLATGRRRAVSVEALEGRTIRVAFNDGAARLYDCTALIEPGTVFAPLASDDCFERVYIDGEGDIAWDIDPTVDSAVVWNNKLDISADTCYVYGTPIEEYARHEADV